MKRAHGGQTGASRVGCLLGLLLLLVGGYAAVQFAGSEFRYRSLVDVVQREANLAAEQDDESIRQTIAEEAARLQLPPTAGRPTIRRFPGGRIEITIQYPDPVEFLGRWEWVLNRRIQIDQTY
ncbi:MAG: hypothetical protein R3195_01395 [Gemmatimonadota bacterium]|nr:hypothetical protein [Gemmatimonadota bacterium]